MNSSELKGYLTGLIFGDGCIDKGITKRAFEIKSIDKNFIDKIKNDIESCTNFQISIKSPPITHIYYNDFLCFFKYFFRLFSGF